MVDKKWMNIKQLAQYFGISESTIKRYRDDKDENKKGLPFHRMGQRVLYDVREVEHWIKNHEETKKAPQYKRKK